jgi:hypothetical protein
LLHCLRGPLRCGDRPRRPRACDQHHRALRQAYLNRVKPRPPGHEAVTFGGKTSTTSAATSLRCSAAAPILRSRMGLPGCSCQLSRQPIFLRERCRMPSRAPSAARFWAILARLLRGPEAAEMHDRVGRHSQVAGGAAVDNAAWRPVRLPDNWHVTRPGTTDGRSAGKQAILLAPLRGSGDARQHSRTSGLARSARPGPVE